MRTQGAVSHARTLAGLNAVLHDLDQADQRARALLEGLSDGEVNWQPRANAWSIAQCLDHLARTNDAYIRAFREAVKNAGPTARTKSDAIKPGWFGGMFIRSLEPPPRQKTRAPRVVIPAPQADKDEVLRAFLRTHDELRALAHESEALDLNRIRFQNPFVSFLRFRVGAGLLIITAHERRHLWQAEQVRQAQSFPAR